MEWTRFMDMHSGGGLKEKWAYIYIEAPEDMAKIIFYNRFGHNPERVTCTCCGDDYSISEEKNIEQITAYERGLAFAYFRPDGTECPESEGWKPGKGITEGYVSRYVERQSERFSFNKYHTLDEYRKRDDVLFIPADEIKETERVGEVPEQGYMWKD